MHFTHLSARLLTASVVVHARFQRTFTMTLASCQITAASGDAGHYPIANDERGHNGSMVVRVAGRWDSEGMGHGGHEGGVRLLVPFVHLDVRVHTLYR